MPSGSGRVIEFIVRNSFHRKWFSGGGWSWAIVRVGEGPAPGSTQELQGRAEALGRVFTDAGGGGGQERPGLCTAPHPRRQR